MSADIGILGGGQLARMTALSARRAGISCIVLDPDPSCPASKVADVVIGRLDDAEAIRRVADQCGALTLENEFVPATSIRESKATIVPGNETLAIVQDKLRQRHVLTQAGVPSPRAVTASQAGEIGFPCVLKRRFGGYDGKGTRYARTEAEYEALRPEWEREEWLAEEQVPFVREIAVMAFMGRDGTGGAFPAVVTQQKNSVCDLVFPLDDPVTEAEARRVARAAVAAIEGVGLFGVELFETADSMILVNEIAPRPHNSGHYSQDWGGLSQFEAHWRLVLGLRLPESPRGRPTAMANLLGIESAGGHLQGLRAMLEDGYRGAKLHWYDKAEARSGRKMGHVNCTGISGTQARKRAIAAQSAFLRGWCTDS
ncbi:MAG: 5-(carboxyamino)imidazole ribonucleotide synthase [Armatimonadota bacterium]